MFIRRTEAKRLGGVPKKIKDTSKRFPVVPSTLDYLFLVSLAGLALFFKL